MTYIYRLWRALTLRPIVPFDTLCLEVFHESHRQYHSVDRAAASANIACAECRSLLARIR